MHSVQSNLHTIRFDISVILMGLSDPELLEVIVEEEGEASIPNMFASCLNKLDLYHSFLTQMKSKKAVEFAYSYQAFVMRLDGLIATYHAKNH